MAGSVGSQVRHSESAVMNCYSCPPLENYHSCHQQESGGTTVSSSSGNWVSRRGERHTRRVASAQYCIRRSLTAGVAAGVQYGPCNTIWDKRVSPPPLDRVRGATARCISVRPAMRFRLNCVCAFILSFILGPCVVLKLTKELVVTGGEAVGCLLSGFSGDPSLGVGVLRTGLVLKSSGEDCILQHTNC